MNDGNEIPGSNRTDSSNTNTGGGAHIGGDVTAGKNVIGRDNIEGDNIETQNNYYNTQDQPNKPTKEQVNNLVTQGIRAQLEGDIATARSIFLRAKEIDPDNHEIAKHLTFVQTEIKRPYVDSHGRVIEESVSGNVTIGHLSSDQRHAGLSIILPLIIYTISIGITVIIVGLFRNEVNVFVTQIFQWILSVKIVTIIGIAATLLFILLVIKATNWLRNKPK